MWIDAWRKRERQKEIGWIDRDIEICSFADAVCQDVVFGTNLDLDDIKYKHQLNELRRAFPAPLRWDSQCCLLSHIGATIPGMSGVQCYIKVFGCRTPGHLENNRFCSVNLNLGPGTCIWWAVDRHYWKKMFQLGLSKGVNLLKDSWWPSEDDLKAAGIRYHRFLQHAGDLVWVHPGCVHWVQSLGHAMAVSWNVGPPTRVQLDEAWNSVCFNSQNSYQSMVPMKRLIFSLCREVSMFTSSKPKKIGKDKRELVGHTADSSWSYLAENDLAKRALELLKVIFNDQSKIYMQLESENSGFSRIQLIDASLASALHWVYCVECTDEIFNILFLKPVGVQHQTVCFKCAKRQLKLKSAADKPWLLQPYELFTRDALCLTWNKAVDMM